MTAQVHEKIIFNSKTESMIPCPPIIYSPELITELSEKEIQKANKAGKLDHIIYSSGCWRGYIGTWEIKDNKFFLNHLEGRIKLVKNEPVHATWFTGNIRILQGEIRHIDLRFLYEKEIHIKIEAGIVTEQITIDTNKLSYEEQLKLVLCGR